MLTYETFVAVLLGAIERAGLNLAYTQELLDTHALGRSLSITCLPDGMEDDLGPVEPSLRAVIAFRWSPEFTVFSLRGGDSLDDIERLVDERLFAQARSGPSLDLEITYHLPLDTKMQHEVAALPVLAHVIQDLHSALVEEPEAIVRVDSTVVFHPGGAAYVHSLTALRIWSLDEALYDHDLLAITFEGLCTELRAMLGLLANHFLPDEPERLPYEGLPSERRYFKPPTA
ncbi:MAG: hypothetical protein AB4911_01895 [Oscillochloridaceae bacterium umkhey_bin13]